MAVVHKVEVIIVQEELLHDKYDIAVVVSDLLEQGNEHGASPYKVTQITVSQIEDTVSLTRNCAAGNKLLISYDTNK